MPPSVKLPIKEAANKAARAALTRIITSKNSLDTLVGNYDVSKSNRAPRDYAESKILDAALDLSASSIANKVLEYIAKHGAAVSSDYVTSSNMIELLNYGKTPTGSFHQLGSHEKIIAFVDTYFDELVQIATRIAKEDKGLATGEKWVKSQIIDFDKRAKSAGLGAAI